MRARRRLTAEERAALDRAALERARESTSPANEAAVVAAFVERGIPEESILPRENVLTFNAWRALGRYVRRGEKAVKVTVWVPSKLPAAVDAIEAGDGEGPEDLGKRRVSAFVFHISQTEAREREVTAGLFSPAGGCSGDD